MGNQIQCSPIPGHSKSKLPNNMFKVKNINEQGEIIWRGIIEVNKTELVLHQKVGDPVRWPLKSLRRYGSDKGLFSFESGRSCATGPGIYAFKCKDAEQLFNMVKTNTNEGSEGATTSGTTSRSPQQRHPSTSFTAMPHNHTNSMSRLISSNGRISGRHTSSTSVGGTSPVSSLPNSNGSTSAPSMLNSNESGPIQYINAADLRETGPSRSSEESHQTSTRSHQPVPRPSHSASNSSSQSAKKVSLNYIHLRLGQDEEDAVIADGSLQVVTADVDHYENDHDRRQELLNQSESCSQATGIPPVPPTSSPPGLKDENGNKTITSESTQNVEAGKRRVKTGLLVEIGSEVNNLNLNRVSPLSSPEAMQGEGPMSYVNLDHSPKMSQSGPRVHSPDFSKKQSYPQPTSPSTYYTNLDTKGELPPHSTVSAQGPLTDLRRPLSGGSKNKKDLEFNFDGNGYPKSDLTYTNLSSADKNMACNPENFPGGSTMIVHSPPKGKLNYIQVAFEDGTVSSVPQRSMSSSSGSTPPHTPNSPVDTESPAKSTEVYAVIDTNKTMALANSQRQFNDGDIGTRRTRHDGPVQQR